MGSELFLLHKFNYYRMNLQHRIDLLIRLGEYILSDDEAWQQAKEKAGQENSWFIPEFVDLATKILPGHFCKKIYWKNGQHNYQLNKLQTTQTSNSWHCHGRQYPAGWFS